MQPISILIKLGMIDQTKSFHYIMEETKISKYLNIINDEHYSFSLNYIWSNHFSVDQTYNLTAIHEYLNPEGMELFKKENVLEFFNQLWK